MNESQFFRGRSVLVTGASGFVGTHFVEELLRLGARVRATVHRRPLFVKDAAVELIRADLTNLEDCQRAMRGMEFAIHAAGSVSAAATGPCQQMAAIADNLVLTTRCLQAAWAENISRFLVFSSSTGYPVAGHPVTEDEFWSGPTFPGYFGYGWMRRYVERLCEYVASRSVMKIALARPGAIYGRYDNFDPTTSHVIPGLIRRAVNHENPFIVWGSGSEVRDFLHVTDFVRGCLALLERHPNCDPVNIAAGEAVTIREVVKEVLIAADHCDLNPIFDSSKPSTIPIRMLDTTKAKELLSFVPSISLDQGILDTVQWWTRIRESGELPSPSAV